MGLSKNTEVKLTVEDKIIVISYTTNIMDLYCVLNNRAIKNKPNKRIFSRYKCITQIYFTRLQEILQKEIKKNISKVLKNGR